MKRLVWLLVAVFCTAFAQVQPVDMPEKKVERCDCCGDQPGACDMPDCAPVPTAGQPVFHQQTVTVARSETRQLTPARRVRFESYYVRFEPKPAALPARGTPPLAAPSANVPLFMAHCSFLI